VPFTPVAATPPPYSVTTTVAKTATSTRRHEEELDCLRAQVRETMEALQRRDEDLQGARDIAVAKDQYISTLLDHGRSAANEWD
jgi:hypothetical protein